MSILSANLPPPSAAASDPGVFEMTSAEPITKCAAAADGAALSVTSNVDPSRATPVHPIAGTVPDEAMQPDPNVENCPRIQVADPLNMLASPTSVPEFSCKLCTKWLKTSYPSSPTSLSTGSSRSWTV